MRPRLNAAIFGVLFACGGAQTTSDATPPDTTATSTATATATSTQTGADASTSSPDATSKPTSTAAVPPPPGDRNRFIGGMQWDGSGKRMVLYCKDECKGPRLNVHLWDVGAEAITSVDVIPDTKGQAVRLVSWSPRGNYLFGSAGDKLVVTTVDGKPFTVIDAPAVYDQFEPSPDESRLAWANAQGELHLVDMKTKADTKEAQLHAADAADSHFFEWSSQNDWFLVGSLNSTQWSVFDVKAKKLKALPANIVFARPSATGDAIVAAGADGFVGLLDPKTTNVRATIRKGRTVKAGETPQIAAALSVDGKKLVVASTDLVVFDLEAKSANTIVGKLEATFPAIAAISPLGTEIALESGGDVLVVDTKVATAPPRVAASKLVGYGADGTLVLKGDKLVLMGFRKGEAAWSVKLPEDPASMAFDPSHDRLAFTVAGRLRIVRIASGKSVLFELVSKDKGKTTQVMPIGITKKEDVDAVLRSSP
ncbi:MAG: hypothetical protein HOW73_16705 [Polyangiaceae bacterium]|nr:hypothetical protein [Polyangiaceae bacterium]